MQELVRQETEQLEEIKKQILPLDERSMEAARKRWFTVAKPLFSLGKLEDAVIQMAGIRRNPDFELKKKGLIIMCADNGVVEEGVTQTGQNVTAAVADNFTKGMSSACIMAKEANVDVFPVDIGMVTDVPSVTNMQDKVAYGTANFAKGPAMTREQVWQAILVGIRKVIEKKEEGYDLLATGEMGIGNTTTSSAVATVLLQEKVPDVTGRGAGLSSIGLQNKIRVIETAISDLRPDENDVIDVLAKVGGLDIAGLCGVFLGGGMYRLPVVIDGFISAAAALCAVRLVPEVSGYLLPSHVSKEPAGKKILDALGKSPFLTCDMCLGEGSGAIAAIPLMEMGYKVYKEMGTFGDMEIEQYQILK